MIRFVRDIRLVPVVLAAVVGLFLLKITGLVFEGGYTLAPRATTRNGVPISPAVRMDSSNVELAPSPMAGTRQSWAQEVFGYPDVTGAVQQPRPAEKETERGAKDRAPEKDAKEKVAEPLQGGGTVIPLEPPRAALRG